MRLLAIILLNTFLAATGRGAAISVADYGAVGDCANITVSVTTNSNVIWTTNTFTAADIGKVMCLFKAGYYADLSVIPTIFSGNYGGTPTNHQDMVVTIKAVDATGTNVTVDSNCGVTATGIACTYGHNNKTNFDNAIADAADPCTINIPSGNYLLIPPTALDTNFVQTTMYSGGVTVTINRGGLTFLGQGTNSTILTGNGAWMQKGLDCAYRGSLFQFPTPIINDTHPLIFNGIQFNGNAIRNHGPYTDFPAVPTDGSGWDVSHHLAVQTSAHTYLSWTNCLMTRWHGETLSGNSVEAGFTDVGNCTFIDGNASALNMTTAQDVHDCWFEDYRVVHEFYQAYASATSYFQRNTVTNIYGTGYGISGAETGRTLYPIVVRSNSFKSVTLNAFSTSAAQNVTLSDNTFDTLGVPIYIASAGYQGTAGNSNIVIQGNTFLSSQVAMLFGGGGLNTITDVRVKNNTATVSENFAESFGVQTNVLFCGNVSNIPIITTNAGWTVLTDCPGGSTLRNVRLKNAILR